MKSIVKYTLLTALRDWLFSGIFILILLSVSLSLLVGGTAVVEQGYMSAAFIAASIRMITIVGLILFVCFHIRRSFENKEIEMILTKPISRLQFIGAYYLGFAVLASTLILPTCLFFALLISLNIVWANTLGMLLWSLSFLLEALIVVGFAFFASLILRSAVTSVLISFGFYFLARIFGFFLIAMHNPASLTHASSIGKFFESILGFIGIFLPRLDMFAKSEWLIHGVMQPDQVFLFLVSSIVYIPLLLIMATFDFVRRQF